MTDADVSNPLQLRLNNGLSILVPRSLLSITTYVLLEQEAWFEKEFGFLRFFLKPGMTAIDIGANLGVYSLLLANLVGRDGRVFAYEPGNAARELLDRSRQLNGLSGLHILDSALSDRQCEGMLAFATSSELRSLSAAGPGERVQVTHLDHEAARLGWISPDFVKLDAEGEEEKIIAGGADFFAKNSPLVMFEIKAGETINERLKAIFPQLGYRLFRQLGGAPVLVPLELGEPIDGYELNLFAAKPDRVSTMSDEGLINLRSDDLRKKDAGANWRNQKFGWPAEIPGGMGEPADPDYADALAAFGVWRAQTNPLAVRCAAIKFALDRLRMICARAPTPERLSTFVRAAFDWGLRSESVGALYKLFKLTENTPPQIREPFWPANSRFDALIENAGAKPNLLFGSAAEHFERTASFSSVFSGPSPFLEWLCGQPFACIEMERRRVLAASRLGKLPLIPQRLRGPASDHLNADVWGSGGVPGTRT